MNERRFTVTRFNAEGDPIKVQESVSETSASVPKAVRQLIGMKIGHQTIQAVEVHLGNVHSIEYKETSS